jgi:uncharacterized Ntn-hydrolase superfamily protein
MKITYFLILLLICNISLAGQDTFSIVAVDSITGEVGSAGASCIANSLIISDIVPGRGAIHTQSFWSAGNQTKARAQMLLGKSPTEVMDYMSKNSNDANFNASNRQYGIADFGTNRTTRAAAFTGPNCFDYKNHIIGPNYSIQGNILSGQAILDSMEARFLSTKGTLADKMMAAMQGANKPGADTRCLPDGTSSLSAFLRIAKPTDPANAFYLDLNVPNMPVGKEPIDSLQTLYTNWKRTISTKETDAEKLEKYNIFPNPSSNNYLEITDLVDTDRVDVFDSSNKLVHSLRKQTVVQLPNPAKGVYLVMITNQNGTKHVRKWILM